MSNLIKASTIRYEETFRNLDCNERADAYQKEFIDEYTRKAALMQLEADSTPEGSKAFDDGFVPGIIPSATFDVDPSESGEFQDEAGSTEYESSEIDELNSRIEELRAEADSIIERAKDEAEMIIEAAKAQAESECSALIETTRQNAYNEGMEAAEQEINGLKETLARQIEDNKLQYAKQVEELEPAFVGLLIRYLSKITGILLEDRRDILNYVIDSALRENVRSSECIIRVPGDDLPGVLAAKEHFEEILGEGAVVSIAEDKLLEKGRCLIETESRIFDCSIEGGLMSLIEDLKILSQKD